MRPRPRRRRVDSTVPTLVEPIVIADSSDEDGESEDVVLLNPPHCDDSDDVVLLSPLQQPLTTHPTHSTLPSSREGKQGFLLQTGTAGAKGNPHAHLSASDQREIAVVMGMDVQDLGADSHDFGAMEIGGAGPATDFRPASSSRPDASGPAVPTDYPPRGHPLTPESQKEMIERKKQEALRLRGAKHERRLIEEYLSAAERQIGFQPAVRPGSHPKMTKLSPEQEKVGQSHPFHHDGSLMSNHFESISVWPFTAVA